VAGPLTVTANLLLSTDQGSTVGLGGLPGRQRINQFGVSPRLGWATLHLGSFSDTYTPLTWTGVRVDGVGADLNPGSLRVGLFAGSSRQAVFGGATSGSFGRTLMGARLGLGRKPAFGPGGRFIDFVILRAADDPTSLPPVSDTIPIPYLPDSLAAEPDTALLPRVPINPYAVTPQENAVLSTSAGLSFFGGALSWSGEIAGSIHSRDRRATLVAGDILGDYPGVLRGLVTPRAGTHADYSYRSQVDLRIARLPGSTTTSPKALMASVGLQSIGAGYVSLGSAFLPNDLKGIDFRAALRARRWSVQVDGTGQRDNLAGQKLATTYRSRFGLAVTVQPVRAWHSMIRVATVSMDRDLVDSAGAIDYSGTTFGTTHTWLPSAGTRLQSLSLSYTFQDMGDPSPLREATSFRSHAADLRVGLALGPNASISPTIGLIGTSVADSATKTRASYGITGEWRGPKRRWLANGSVSRSQLGRTNALTTRVTARFPLTAADALTLLIRTSRYRSAVEGDRGFDERTVSLRWSRRL
jgi:hypothetical protein